MDRLKPASLDATLRCMDTSMTLQHPVASNILKETVTRSGRHVRWHEF